MILQKLKIKPPHRFLCLNAPETFESKLATDGCTFLHEVPNGGVYDSVHWFLQWQRDLEAGLPIVLSHLKPGMPCWVYYPKGTGKVPGDVNRDKGWQVLESRSDIRWLSMIAFDSDWTAFCFRIKTEKDLAEEAKPAPEREIFKWADSTTKTIRLPEDLENALAQHAECQAFWDKLSFSCRREYVEWIVTAKQAETRNKRIEGTLERLAKGQKTPSGR